MNIKYCDQMSAIFSVFVSFVRGSKVLLTNELSEPCFANEFPPCEDTISSSRGINPCIKRLTDYRIVCLGRQ